MQEIKKNNNSRDEIHARYTDQLQNKHRDGKGIKYNPSLGQNTGLQKKLGAPYKQVIP